MLTITKKALQVKLTNTLQNDRISSSFPAQKAAARE